MKVCPASIMTRRRNESSRKIRHKWLDLRFTIGVQQCCQMLDQTFDTRAANGSYDNTYTGRSASTTSLLASSSTETEPIERLALLRYGTELSPPQIRLNGWHRGRPTVERMMLGSIFDGLSKGVLRCCAIDSDKRPFPI